MQNKLMLTTVTTGAVAALIMAGGLFLVSHNDEFAENAHLSQNVAATVVPFTKLTDGMQSKITERINYVITSGAEMSELWKTIGATTTPPIVDFKTNSVLAVFAGKNSNGAISISKIVDTNERLVSITIVQKEGACVKTKPVGVAYELVVASSTSLPLTHEDNIATSTCK